MASLLWHRKCKYKNPSKIKVIACYTLKPNQRLMLLCWTYLSSLNTHWACIGGLGGGDDPSKKEFDYNHKTEIQVFM